MDSKKHLQNRIRGWLPKDYVKVYLHRMSKPMWWKPFWISLLIVTIASAILFFFTLHMPIQQVIIGTVFAFVCIPIGFILALPWLIDLRKHRNYKGQ